MVLYLWKVHFQGNAAFKGRQWNKAVNYYGEAIKLNGENATFYCNRAAAYLELGWYVCISIKGILDLKSLIDMDSNIE